MGVDAVPFQAHLLAEIVVDRDLAAGQTNQAVAPILDAHDQAMSPVTGGGRENSLGAWVWHRRETVFLEAFNPVEGFPFQSDQLRMLDTARVVDQLQNTATDHQQHAPLQRADQFGHRADYRIHPASSSGSGSAFNSKAPGGIRLNSVRDPRSPFEKATPTINMSRSMASQLSVSVPGGSRP